jgi:hypothetical protein
MRGIRQVATRYGRSRTATSEPLVVAHSSTVVGPTKFTNRASSLTLFDGLRILRTAVSANGVAIRFGAIS